MIKIVQFIHGLNMGGAETLVKDYALLLDKTKFELTVLCLEHRESPYEKLLADNGIKVIYVCDKMPLYQRKDIISRCINGLERRALVKKIIDKLSPDIIHIHLLLNEYIYYSKPKKCTGIVYTQHFATNRWKEKYPKEIHYLQELMKRYPTKIIALNNDMKNEMVAILGTTNTFVLNNGINFDKFRTLKAKNVLRNELGVPQNAFVLGHVGRFSKVKNHEFLIDVFAEIAKKKDNAYLIMIGTGETMENVKSKIKALKLNDKVRILSNRTDVPDLMGAMDVLVFPSFSEGMPVTLVEAQLAGLKCLVSDRISPDIQISNLIRYKSLNTPAEDWADDILSWGNEGLKYHNIEEWNMHSIVGKLEQLYTNLYKESRGES